MIQPSDWKRPSGYSNGMLVPPGYALLVMAGQIGWTPSQQLVEGGFLAQFERALSNVCCLVEEAGGSAQHLVRLTIFVTDKALYLGQLAAVGQAYRVLLGRHFPCMSLVEVAALVETGALVEIEATAALPPAAFHGES